MAFAHGSGCVLWMRTAGCETLKDSPLYLTFPLWSESALW